MERDTIGRVSTQMINYMIYQIEHRTKNGYSFKCINCSIIKDRRMEQYLPGRSSENFHRPAAMHMLVHTKNSHARNLIFSANCHTEHYATYNTGVTKSIYVRI